MDTAFHDASCWNVCLLATGCLQQERFLLKNSRIAVHKVCEGAQILLVKKSDRELGLNDQVSTLLNSQTEKMKLTAPLMPNALTTRQL